MSSLWKLPNSIEDSRIKFRQELIFYSELVSKSG